jgi:hypothetical protein
MSGRRRRRYVDPTGPRRENRMRGLAPTYRSRSMTATGASATLVRTGRSNRADNQARQTVAAPEEDCT